MTFADWIAEPVNWAFLAMAIPMVVAALRVVTSRNVVHAALFLVLTLAASAGVFILLSAEFVAWVLVLVYIGAVIVLFLFGIMITRAPIGRETNLSHDTRWPAALASLAVLAVTLWLIIAVSQEIGGFGDPLPAVGVATPDRSTRGGIHQPLPYPLRGGGIRPPRGPGRWRDPGSKGPHPARGRGRAAGVRSDPR